MLPHGAVSNEGGKEGKKREGSKRGFVCFPCWTLNYAAYFCFVELPGALISAYCVRSGCLARAAAPGDGLRGCGGGAVRGNGPGAGPGAGPVAHPAPGTCTPHPGLCSRGAGSGQAAAARGPGPPVFAFSPRPQRVSFLLRSPAQRQRGPGHGCLRHAAVGTARSAPAQRQPCTPAAAPVRGAGGNWGPSAGKGAPRGRDPLQHPPGRSRRFPPRPLGTAPPSSSFYLPACLSFKHSNC